MTPKEKAKELFDKYCYAIRENEDDDGYFTNTINAKRCANITVDEIMKTISFSDNINFMYIIDWWQEVKQEIEKI
jgi:hypothetical protein